MSMAQMVVVQLIDDIDGGDADETVSFALDGKTYEIELSKKNAAILRKTLAPYIEKGRTAGRSPSSGRGRPSPTAHKNSGTRTLFSGLGVEDKQRFRAWADMPTARRVSDARVQAWIEQGRP